MLRFEPWSRAGTLLAAALIVSASVAGSPAHADATPELTLGARLSELRERIVHRRAFVRMLEDRTAELSVDMNAPGQEGLAVGASTVDQEEDLRLMERELDRLIPKLLPRLEALESLRKQGTRVLAELARKEREGALSDQVRSRLAAANPMMLDQLRRATASVRLLRRHPNDLISRHRELDFRLPVQAAVSDRLGRSGDSRRNQRNATVRELADAHAELEDLLAEERRLSRTMLANRLTLAALEEATHEPVPVGGAAVRGIVMPAARLSAGSSAVAGLSAWTRGSSRDMVPVLPGLTAEARSPVLVAGWTSQPGAYGVDRVMASIGDGGARLSLASLQGGAIDAISARVGPGLPSRANPLIPTAAAGSAFGFGDPGRPLATDIQIAAVPGQPVAAPEDGRVVFAGGFRSYGLLLIIEHDNEYHTLLWGFSRLDMRLGDQVGAGQIVGVMGTGQLPKLHVELRRNGQPVSPELWLAASNSGVKG